MNPSQITMNIINVGYDSTNYYLVEFKGGKLLIDCGWPGTLPKFMAALKSKGIAMNEIKYLLVTHFHPDHAGLTQELKKLGIKLILLESQVSFIPHFAEFFMGKNFPYVEITQHDNLVLKFEDSRQFLAGLGISGEIIATPGHSDDSVTLILDEGIAFTGDLHPRFMVSEEDHVTQESWDKIYRHKITKIFPAHGGQR
ncbi:MAG TPA: MBL fold metallo-hydrolase [Anaerolineales bacterium]|nr:MBL fold metallo-hydrolase [Anaerolineales bacterium]